MKIFYWATGAALSMVIGFLPAYAQDGARATAAGSGTAAAAAALPAPRLAFVNTEVFADEKQGITRLVSAVKTVQAEFRQQQAELQQMQTRLQGMADDIQKNQNGPDQVSLRRKQDDAQALQRQLKYKADEAQAAYDKRLQAVAGPVFDDVGKALDVFAKQRGVTMLLDISKLGPTLLYADGNLDLTRAFIAEYNSRSPGASPK